MVWWTHTNKSKYEIKEWLCFKSVPDLVIQTVNVMYDCHDPNVNGYEYHILTNAGVNIFNVDLTQHDQEFFRAVKETLLLSEKIEKEYSRNYYRPIGFSVTISVKEPYELDDRVDIVILKDITKMKELLEFRKQNEKFKSMPILIWPSYYEIDDLNELIKRSAGIILEKNFLDSNLGDFLRVLKFAKEAFKPVFHIESNMVQDYHNDISQSQARRILTHTNNIINYGLDGVVVVECAGKSAETFIRAIVRATELSRQDIKRRKKYFDWSFQVKTPVLPPISSAFGASAAALYCKAKAIIVLTMSGASARLLAKTAPPCHIIAVTAHESTARYLHLYLKVLPVYYKKSRETSWHEEYMARVVFGTQFGFEIGLLDYAAKLVVLAPLDEGCGYCNGFQILDVSQVVKSRAISRANF
ncbi:unnamed protein product [Arctia plantaginis]|uniref:Pyruvate kinase C-terminal domain-containing protein n=1 Tax=Arctia plantaginis TaxID=874455 RepID=A0A8S1BD76_ARCPL|nr:unnamed protein product [Arctia plantaginis]